MLAIDMLEQRELRSGQKITARLFIARAIRARDKIEKRRVDMFRIAGLR